MKFVVAALVFFVPVVALAQTARPSVDPRIAPQMLAATESVLALRESMLKAMSEDMQKREREWAEYSRPLWDFKGKE